MPINALLKSGVKTSVTKLAYQINKITPALSADVNKFVPSQSHIARYLYATD
jgi:hypothetical protein